VRSPRIGQVRDVRATECTGSGEQPNSGKRRHDRSRGQRNQTYSGSCAQMINTVLPTWRREPEDHRQRGVRLQEDRKNDTAGALISIDQGDDAVLSQGDERHDRLAPRGRACRKPSDFDGGQSRLTAPRSRVYRPGDYGERTDLGIHPQTGGMKAPGVVASWRLSRCCFFRRCREGE